MLKEPQRLPFYAILTQALAGELPRVTLGTYIAQADCAQTRVFLAIQAYKARFGGYPASIQELRSKLGWKLPKDTFSGKDFIYSRQAKGFILYSIGPDMKDDGGRKIPGDSVELHSKGDIVLRWDR